MGDHGTIPSHGNFRSYLYMASKSRKLSPAQIKAQADAAQPGDADRFLRRGTALVRLCVSGATRPIAAGSVAGFNAASLSEEPSRVSFPVSIRYSLDDMLFVA